MLRPLLTRPKKVRVSPGRNVFLRPPVVVGTSIYAGDWDDQVYCLNEDLNVAWRIPAEDFVVEQNIGEMLVLESVRKQKWRGVLQTGEVAWTIDVETPCLVWRERIWLRASPHARLVNPKTGEVVEELPVPGRAVVNGDLCVYDGEKGLCLYDLERRQRVWERDLVGEVHARYGPDVVGEHLGFERVGPGFLVGMLGRSLLGFSASDGSLLWRVPIWIPSRFPLVHQGRIYAWSWRMGETGQLMYQGDVNHLVCLDEATGRVVYDISLKEHGGEFVGAHEARRAAIDGEHIVFTTRQGLVAVFRLSDGGLVWSYKYQHELYEPVIAGDRLLATASDGNLLVFESRG